MRKALLFLFLVFLIVPSSFAVSTLVIGGNGGGGTVVTNNYYNITNITGGNITGNGTANSIPFWFNTTTLYGSRFTLTNLNTTSELNLLYAPIGIYLNMTTVQNSLASLVLNVSSLGNWSADKPNYATIAQLNTVANITYSAGTGIEINSSVISLNVTYTDFRYLNTYLQLFFYNTSSALNSSFTVMNTTQSPTLQTRSLTLSAGQNEIARRIFTERNISFLNSGIFAQYTTVNVTNSGIRDTRFFSTLYKYNATSGALTLIGTTGVYSDPLIANTYQSVQWTGTVGQNVFFGVNEYLVMILNASVSGSGSLPQITLITGGNTSAHLQVGVSPTALSLIETDPVYTLEKGSIYVNVTGLQTSNTTTNQRVDTLNTTTQGQYTNITTAQSSINSLVVNLTAQNGYNNITGLQTSNATTNQRIDVLNTTQQNLYTNITTSQNSINSLVVNMSSQNSYINITTAQNSINSLVVNLTAQNGYNNITNLQTDRTQLNQTKFNVSGGNITGNITVTGVNIYGNMTIGGTVGQILFGNGGGYSWNSTDSCLVSPPNSTNSRQILCVTKPTG